MQTADRQTRYDRLDGFRGMFMVLMVTTHFAVLFPAELQYFKFHYFGYVEDAQGFVFLSGITAGIAYGRRLIQRGFGAMARAVLLRLRKIYVYQIVLVVCVALLAAIFWDGTSRQGMFAAFHDHPFAYPLASLALLTAAPFINILPMYIVLMAATPLVLWALGRGMLIEVILVSALLWLIVQSGMTDIVLDRAIALLAEWGLAVPLGTNFNVLAWQVLYVAGICLGFRVAEGRTDQAHFRSAIAARLLPIVVMVCLFFAVLDIAENLGYADFLSASLAGNDRRYQLPLIYVASFVGEAYLLAWLLLAGDMSRLAVIRRLSAVLNGLFRLGFLRLIGRQSIWVYAVHVIFLYSWVLFVRIEDPGFVQRNLIFALVAVATYPVARANGWFAGLWRAATGAGRGKTSSSGAENVT